MNMQMSELMMSSPHNFPYILFTEIMQKLNAESTLNKMQNNVWSDLFWYGDMFLHIWEKNNTIVQISYTIYMENNEAMKSTHSFTS